jgi:hypothetical protein
MDKPPHAAGRRRDGLVNLGQPTNPPKKRMRVVCRAAAKKQQLDRRKSLFCTRFSHCQTAFPFYDAEGIFMATGKIQKLQA